MYPTGLEQLVAHQHTADLRADAAHRRLVRRSRTATMTATSCTPGAGRPNPRGADILADARSAPDDTPEPLSWLPRPARISWWRKVPMPGTAFTRKVSAALVCALLFLVLAAAATVARHRTGNVPTPVSTSTSTGHGGGSRVSVK